MGVAAFQADDFYRAKSPVEVFFVEIMTVYVYRNIIVS